MTDKDRLTRGRMGRIDRLEADLRDMLHALLRGGKTQREILDLMNQVLGERGEEPLSAAGLNRYVNRASIREIAERSRIANQFGEAIGRAADEDGGTKLDRGLVNFGQTLAIETMAALDQAELPADEKLEALKVYALITRRLNTSAAAIDARERAIRADLAEKAAQAAVDAAGKEAAAAGAPFSPEALKQIREEVYGIFDESPA